MSTTIDTIETEQSGFHNKYIGFYNAVKVIIDNARQSGKQFLTIQEVQEQLSVYFTKQNGFAFKDITEQRVKAYLAPSQMSKRIKGVTSGRNGGICF